MKEKLEELKNFFTSLPSRTNKPLSKITIVNYVSKFNKLCQIVNGCDFDGNFDFLNNYKKVLSSIEKAEMSGKKDILSPVLRILKHNDAPAELISIYQKALSDFKTDEYSVRKQNKASDKNEKLSLPLPEVQEKIKRFEVKTSDDLMYKLICEIYFNNKSLVPRNDLNIVKLANAGKKNKDFNKDFNYLLLKDGNPISWFWCHYKTSHSFGCVKFGIPDVLSALLKQYILVFKKQNGDFLFTKKNGNEYSKKDFLDLIGKATEIVLGKRMTINLIRQILITHYYENGAKTIAQDEADAHRYLHGLSVHKEYFRTNLNSHSNVESEED